MRDANYIVLANALSIMPTFLVSEIHLTTMHILTCIFLNLNSLNLCNIELEPRDNKAKANDSSHLKRENIKRKKGVHHLQH